MAAENSSWHQRASANLREARKKNGRLGSKKARTGCITCKRRRVKCDEQYPACRRCIVSGWQCEGYKANQSQPPTPGSVSDDSISIVEPPLPSFVGLKDRDRRALDFFVGAAAPRLGGDLDRDFWCNHVLQISQCEPLVLDSILAISTLYEHPQFLSTFYKKNALRRTEKSVHTDEFHSQALMLYNRAIRSFRQRITDGTATPLLALMSCALFFCIELIRDNIYAAFDLYLRGAELLKQYMRDESCDQNNSVIGLIKLMFGRIGTLAPAFANQELLDIVATETSTTKCLRFRDMAQARSSLFALMMGQRAFIQDAKEWKRVSFGQAKFDIESSLSYNASLGHGRPFESIYGVVFQMIDQSGAPERSRLLSTSSFNTRITGIVEDGSPTDSSGSGKCSPNLTVKGPDLEDTLRPLTQTQSELLGSLHSWLEAFKDLSTHLQQNRDPSQSYLLIYYHASEIWLTTRLMLSETSYDTFTPQFELILQHAEFYLDSFPTPAPTFTIEIGAVPALFLVAQKCRVPSLRRRALGLMIRAPRKECMHGSASTAEFARRLIEIEEEGLGLPVPDMTFLEHPIEIDDSIVPPDDRRICNPELLHDVESGSYEVRFERYVHMSDSIHLNISVLPL